MVSRNHYDIAALERAVDGVDAVVCAYAGLPELALEGQLLLLRAAERAGVKVCARSLLLIILAWFVCIGFVGIRLVMVLGWREVVDQYSCAYICMLAHDGWMQASSDVTYF